MSTRTVVLLTKLTTETLLSAICERKQNVLRREILRKVSDFLLTYRGKEYSAFEPAVEAWHQQLYNPYGVVIGAVDMGLFMYYYSIARTELEEKTEKICRENFFSSADAVFKGDKDGIGFSACIIDPQKLRESEAVDKIFGGEFHADLGFYSLEHGKAFLNPAEWQEVIKNAKKYALCVLDMEIN